MSVSVTLNGGQQIAASVGASQADVSVVGGSVSVGVASPAPVIAGSSPPITVQASLPQSQPVTAEVSAASGRSWQEQFETVSKNLSSRPATLAYADGALSSVTYSLAGGGQIIKTFHRTAGRLTSIVLSGDTPAGIALTKTLTYAEGGALAGVAYTA